VRRLKLFALLPLAIASLTAARCSSLGPEAGSDSISILSYNVSNLFDDRDDGGEYPEFSIAAGKWSAARFRERLERVSEAVLEALPSERGADGRGVRGAGPDILCLVEVENENALDALLDGPLVKSAYRYRAMSRASGSAVNCALASRFPIKAIRSHSFALGAAGSASGGSTTGGSREGRRLLEVELEVRGRSLTVFVCHWKSKLGGGAETEAERIGAAALLSSRAAVLMAADPEAEFLAAGDFNEGPDEYLLVGRKYATALFPVEEVAPVSAEGRAGGGGASGSGDSAALEENPAGEPGVSGGGSGGSGGGSGDAVAVVDEAASEEAAVSRFADGLLVSMDPERAGFFEGRPVLYSPWGPSKGFSYAYEGRRERIDGFLLSPGLLDAKGAAFDDFSVVDAAFLLDSKGFPLGWKPGRSGGYSDHLPIALELAVEALKE